MDIAKALMILNGLIDLMSRWNLERGHVDEIINRARAEQREVTADDLEALAVRARGSLQALEEAIAAARAAEAGPEPAPPDDDELPPGMP